MKMSLGKFEFHFIRKPKCRYERDELVHIYLTPERLSKKVAGCIKCCCDAHPEIPKTLIGSITKRIVGEIMTKNGIPEYMIEE